ncbi:response regulator [Leptospira kobayashii]|uniref:Response regulator n=1 Tax=Leptospira kobayashii TaxID=1917830 RepID=A0ABM7UGP3_9LEPT|nr:response regulator [Leptospira kobayashii]BDA77713.1 response regulator [Leptospira kobayashii]
MSKSVFLCVDDESSILGALKEQLRSAFGLSYIYETAESAEEAIEIIDEYERPDETIVIIVSDWLMPGMKGDEFFIKINNTYPKIKKILLTGQADPESIDRAKNIGKVQVVLAKPWTQDSLIQSIQGLLAS